jgi:hypothetical protein
MTRRRTNKMIVGNVQEVKGVIIESAEAKGILKKVLISPSHGWEGYVMRSF